MKTLDREKSEALFNEFKELGIRVSQLGSVVQNPDFVSSNNAEECFKGCFEAYDKCIKDLIKLYKKTFELYVEVLN